MGHTATNVFVHFIFSTHRREPPINLNVQADLYATPRPEHNRPSLTFLTRPRKIRSE
jgi:hypothetical protein